MIFKGFSGKQSCHVFGQIGGKCHLSSGYRMEKAKTVRVKRLPVDQDRKSTRLNSSHIQKSRMPSSA